MPRTIGPAVRRLRRAAKFSQVELAERAGISVATVQRIEAGATTPTVATVIAIAAALGVDLSELLT